MVRKTGKMYTFELKTDAKEVILKGSWDGWKGESKVNKRIFNINI